ncbi:hypothetical protein ES708_25931 [subsurface metagenome]
MVILWLLGLIGLVGIIFIIIAACLNDYTKDELTIVNNARTKENKKEKIDDFLLRP